MALITKLTTPLTGKLRYSDDLNTKVEEIIDHLNNLSNGNDVTVPGSLTVTGTATLNGPVVLGDAAADTMTVNATTTYNEPILYDNETGITAFAGGGQASAIPLTAEINDITVCATAGDSVKLPAAASGLHIYVKNSGATALAIYPASNDSIDALAINLAIRIQPGSSINFYAKNPTVWESDKDSSITLIAPTTNTGGLEVKAAASAANYVTTVTNASQAANRTYTIPDAGANAEFVMNAGTQSIGGTKVFTGSLSTDTIIERTPATGVTIDGALLKDGALTPANGTVTQITSITTGVTLSQPAGIITTVTATTAALSTSTFTVTNSFVTDTSNIQCTITDYSGTIVTDGIPLIVAAETKSGAFDIILYNAHATNALNGTLDIAFVIFK